MPGAALIYSDSLARFDFGDDHPLKPIRARNFLELCHRHGLLDAPGVSRHEPEPSDEDLLLLFHTSEYLQLLRRASQGEHDLELLAAGLGTPDCPVLPGILDFSRLVVGATVLALDLVLSGEVARSFNPLGGMHHAGRGHAEGFCYVNDGGVAITRALARGLRVAYVDIDAHHANGIQDAFYDEDRVLVISLHEREPGFYPGTGDTSEIGIGAGEGFTVNLPLAAHTDDALYVEVFERIVPPLIEAFRPDVVLAEIGADTMISDPLTHLRLTTNGYERVLKRLCALAPRLVALGGGGYDLHRTANCWTLAFGALAGVEPEDIYAGLVGGMMYGAAVGGLRDIAMTAHGPQHDRARALAAIGVRAIEDLVFPRLGAKVA